MPQTDTTPATPRASRRSAQWWLEQVRAWQASGLSKTEYCAANGLKPASLYRWASRFRREGQPIDHRTPRAAHSPFVRAVVREEDPAALACALTVEGITVQFESGMEPTALAEWVRALRTLAC